MGVVHPDGGVPVFDRNGDALAEHGTPFEGIYRLLRNPATAWLCIRGADRKLLSYQSPLLLDRTGSIWSIPGPKGVRAEPVRV